MLQMVIMRALRGGTLACEVMEGSHKNVWGN